MTKFNDKIHGLIEKALSGNVEITDAHQLIKVLEYEQKYLESQCENCELKKNKKTVKELFEAILGNDDSICITPEEFQEYKKLKENIK